MLGSWPMTNTTLSRTMDGTPHVPYREALYVSAIIPALTASWPDPSDQRCASPGAVSLGWVTPGRAAIVTPATWRLPGAWSAHGVGRSASPVQWANAAHMALRSLRRRDWA